MLCKQLLIACFLGLTLTGCASLNSDFECKMKSGIPCKSIEEINHIVDQTLSTQNEVAVPNQKTLRIWFPAYEDDEHTLHEARVVHAIINEKT